MLKEEDLRDLDRFERFLAVRRLQERKKKRYRRIATER